MPIRLRKFLLSVPVITATGVFIFYVLFGFFALPALVKWQAEKQVPARLDHQLSIGSVRFNPFTLKIELHDIALADSRGRPMLRFKRLLVDFELRSAIDRAWHFAQATLEAPMLHLELDKEGRHNFAALIERLRDTEPEKESEGLPRIIVKRLVLADGRIAVSDRLLDEAIVAEVAPLALEIDNLSTLPAQTARYRLSARNAAGESLETSGDLGLNPVASKGTLSLNDLKVATLVRGLTRFLALDSPAGTLALSASFELQADRGGTLSGTARDVNLDMAGLSVSAAGAAAPLLSMQTLSLKKGQVELDKRQAMFEGLRLAKGSVAASTDAQGQIDWTSIVRASPVATPKADPSPGTSAEAGVQDAAQAPPWKLSVANVEVSELAVSFSDTTTGRSANIAAFGLEASPAIAFGAADIQVELDKPRLTLSDARLDQGSSFLHVPTALIEAVSVSMSAAGRRIDVTLDAPRLATPEGMSAAQGEASFELGSTALRSARATMGQADAVITGAIDEPHIAMTGISLKQSGHPAQVREASVEGQRIALQAGPGQVEVGIEKLRSALTNLQAQRGTDGVDLGKASISGEKLTVTQAEGQIRVVGSGARASAAGVAARRGSDRIALKDATLDVKALSASTGTSPAPLKAEARLEGATLQLASLGIAAQGASSEFARVATASVDAKSLVLALSDGPPDVTGSGLSMAASGALLRNRADTTELVRLGSATLSGGMMSLRDRTASAEKVALSQGVAKIWIDAKGRLGGLIAVGEAAGGAKKVHPKPAPTPAWQVAVKSTELTGFSLGFEDRRASPPFAAGLESVHARASGLDTGSTTPMQVGLEAKVASGGEIRASGSVRADNGHAHLKVGVTGVALAPVQTYLSDVAKLQLASGALSTEGRLRYGDEAGAGAKLAYQGSVAIERLLLEEIEPKRPFLAWDSVASSDLVLTLAPNRIDIGELQVDRPSGRLIIAEDQTVNVMDVLKKPAAAKDAPRADAHARKDTGPAADNKGSPGDAPFPVTVARIRVSGGLLEFADLSLRPQFSTRMHELKGVITGLASDARRSAKLQLDARIDKYGAAKIRGQISVLRPEAFTEIDMAFRNLEMTSLSPYIAKFAGYKIASGRLALDLQYRVKNAKLVGANRIVLNQVELGEKVESPNALDLPLELAIAILKDADGVIDIELPISGNLEDPQFDYGAVIGKALGNLLGAIVTAPFRALGALFSAGDKKLDTIDFEPGSDAITPPERQKLEAVARALRERPALVLIVPPTYAAEEDASVMKSRAVRTDIVTRMGIKLAPGEDPGPIDIVNPRVERAVEEAFSERYAPKLLAVLKQRALDAAAPEAEAPPAAGPIVTPDSTPPEREPPGPPTAFYQLLVERMIQEEPVSEQMLAQLATRRSDAIVRELTTAGGVPAARVVLGDARNATDANEKAVTLRLALEVAK